jgi:hypothetical protein
MRRFGVFLLISLASIALAGCCMSGNGCYAPLPGTPIAWDGLGTDDPNDGTQNIARKPKSRPKTEIVTGSIGDSTKVRSGELSGKAGAEKLEERDGDAALARKLIICRGCSSSPTKDE